MKKIFTLIAALTLSAGLWATSIWSGSQDVHWDNPIKIDASKFASALPGNKITISIWVNDGTNDEIEFKANGQKLPGTRFSLCQDWWETYDLFMTQDMIDSCKVYGMEICGDNFEVTNVDLSEGKAASMKEGKAIWTGYFWVDSWSTLEVFKEALTAVKDWDKYKTMRFYSECPTTDNLIFLLADWTEAGEIAKSEPATDEIAGNPLKRYEGYAELDLTKVNPLTFINNVASDRLMMMMDKQGSAGFNFTDVVLLEGPEENVYGITVNGTPVLGIKNENPQDPSFEEWFVLNQSLETGDLVTLYNQNGGATWVVTLDEASVPGIELNATRDAYIITQDGCYDFYMKLKFGVDQLYVGYHTAPEYKYTEYENWQLKHEGSEWQWTENLVKVEEGLFKLADANWTGSGFNVGSDANPIKKDWFSPEELVLGEELIAPVIVDVYLKVIDDETVMIGVGVEPSAPASGPTVDETGITVNGRKYGFPVRLVKEVK